MKLFKDWFYYDETSSTNLRWKMDKFVGKNYNIHRIIKDSEAGHRGQRSSKVMLEGKHYAVHRIILTLHGISISQKEVVDHIDGDPFNNRIDNLRVVTQAVNSRNQKKSRINTSGLTGVCLHLNRYWKAQWYEDSKLFAKYFSISRYGYDCAKELAYEYRAAKISELNNKNYKYSERHGN